MITISCHGPLWKIDSLTWTKSNTTRRKYIFIVRYMYAGKDTMENSPTVRTVLFPLGYYTIGQYPWCQPLCLTGLMLKMLSPFFEILRKIDLVVSNKSIAAIKKFDVFYKYYENKSNGDRLVAFSVISSTYTF